MYKDKEEFNTYMREYMRNYRQKKDKTKTNEYMRDYNKKNAKTCLYCDKTYINIYSHNKTKSHQLNKLKKENEQLNLKLEDFNRI